MRIVVCGAGAIGSALGGYLARSGVPVLLVTRPRHADAIRADGLVLGTAEGELRIPVPVAEHPNEVDWRSDDRIFLTTKSQHTEPLLDELSDAPRELPVFCLQNGVRNEEWAGRVFSRVYGGVVQLSATIVAPGTVDHTRGSRVVLGRAPEGLDDEAAAVGDLLTRAGIEVTLDPRVMDWKWGKLLLNLNNALYALTDTWVERATADPAYRGFMAETMREGLRVLRAGGIEPRLEPDRGIDEYIENLAGRKEGPVLRDPRRDRRTYPSTWQDLRRGRGSTEVPYFNGEIVRMGEELGLDTPYNSTLLERSQELVERGAAPGAYTLTALAEEVRGRRQAP